MCVWSPPKHMKGTNFSRVTSGIKRWNRHVFVSMFSLTFCPQSSCQMDMPAVGVDFSFYTASCDTQSNLSFFWQLPAVIVGSSAPDCFPVYLS